MADPIDQVLDDIDPNKPPETTVVPETPVTTGQVTLTKEQYDALQNQATQFQEYAPVLEQLRNNPGLIHDARARAIETPPPSTDPEAFWQNPEATVDQAITKRLQQQVAPQAAAMNAKFASIAIQNFKAMKQSDPFYAVVSPIFDKEMEKIPREQLGAADDSLITRTLNVAWNAAVGEYVQRRQAEKPKAPPVNIGGGGGGAPAGPKDKRHLKEIDPIAYQWAVENGLSEEQMAEIAEETEG